MKNGIIKEYFENGNIKSINNYLNDNLHGLCQTFFENGNLESSWLFKDDMRPNFELIWKLLNLKF